MMAEIKEGGSSSSEKKLLLYEKQKKLLDSFLMHKAITPEQYKKSLDGLKIKMNITSGENS